MEWTLVIKGKLPGLNEYTAANRSNPYVGAKMKRDAQNLVCAAIRSQLRALKISKPVWLHYKFFGINKRRDHDNVESFAHKVIQDALVECGVLKDDGWAEIQGDNNEFEVDKKWPRIEVTITEV